MKALRTPEARFANLPGDPFAPNYVEVDGLRITTSTKARAPRARC